ncbi:MAG: HAMP domain-containing protein [Planctomycetes bacterium]|nr:HAMP domain-containing protein [Planctomycetota bacterium]
MKPFGRGIRFRLVFFYTCIMVLAMLVFSVCLYLSLRGSAQEAFDLVSPHVLGPPDEWDVVISPEVTLIKSLAVALIGFLGFSVVAGWLLVSKTLERVGSIIRSTERITEGNLKERLRLSGTRDELDDLCITLNKMISRLEGLLEQASQFAADVSHELRTPLTVMAGELEVTLQHGKSEADYRNALESSLEEIARLVKIADDLLTLERVGAERGHIEFHEVDLKKLLKKIHEDIRILAESKEIEFKLDPLPGITIMGDQHTLTRLLINLVDNAAKYTDPGGTITLSLAKDEEFANITVADTGIGIPQEDIPKIFDRFYVVDKSRSGAVAGTGLGLSMCKAIAEMHEGHIRVESYEGKGSRFTVRLPLPKKEEAE